MLTYGDLTIFNLIIYWTLQIIIWYANSFYINKYSYSSILFWQSLSIIFFLFDTIALRRPSNGIAILRHDTDRRMTIGLCFSVVYVFHSLCMYTSYDVQFGLYIYICATYIHTGTSGIWTWRSLNDIFRFVRQLPICIIGVIRFSVFVPYNNNIIIITTMKNQAD